MKAFFRCLTVAAFTCFLAVGSAIAALPAVQDRDIADFLTALSQPGEKRDIAFEARLVELLRKKPDLDAAAEQLAPAFALTRPQARRLSELWVLYVLYEKNVFFSFAYEQRMSISSEESDRREKIFKAELRDALVAFARDTKHADVALATVVRVLSTYPYDCERADFDAIAEGATPQITWQVARDADCSGFWLGANARQPMHPAILLRMAEYGLMSRAQRIAVVEFVRRQIPQSLDREARVALDGYLARSLIYDNWDAGLVESGLDLYEGLPEAVRRFVLSDRVPEALTFGDYARKLDTKRPEFPIPEAHEPHEQLAAALLVRGRVKDARNVLGATGRFGVDARTALTCMLTVASNCAGLDSRMLRWLYLDSILNRPADDPYDLFELANTRFVGWGNSGVWIEVLRRTVQDANYRALEAGSIKYWDADDTHYNRDDVSAVEATFDGPLRTRVAEVRKIFAARTRTMGSESLGGLRDDRPALVAPKSAHFPEMRLPACKGTSKGSPLAAKALPGDYASVRVERRGDVVAAISLSQNYDPAGEVSSGGYWVHLSSDGGKTWESPRYTGLSQFFPYEVQPQSCLPMITDNGLQIEVAVKEINTASITYPPVGTHFRRQETGLYLDMPFAELRKDKDGDGLTDIAEESLLLDAGNADTDGDGLADGVDGFPNVRFSGKPGPNDGAMAAVIGAMREQGLNAIIEPVEGSRGVPGGGPGQPLSLDRPLFIRANKGDFGAFTAPQTTLVYSDEEAERIRSVKADFNAIWFSPLTLDRAGTRGFIRWSAGWTGGAFRVIKTGDRWRVEDLGGWIT